VTRSLVIDGLKFAIADKEKLIPGENDEYYAIFYSAAGSLTVKNNTEVKITSEVAAGEDPEESILGIGTSTNPTAITVQNTTVEIAATGVDSDAGGACGIWLDAPTISLSSVTVDTSAATFEDSNNDSGIGINLNRVENLANVSVSGLTITVNTGRPSVEVTNAAAESGKVFGATMPEDDAVFTPSATSFNGQTVLDLFNAIVGQQPGVGYILRFWEGVQGPAGKHALKNTAEGWIHNPVS
jgi:hypothetical protein